ncbi:hypothetical protein HME9302_00976 [Alteripontixanthobacter maritimus]|uniref:Uncharacterized protein n=1 Tax=Alteripontixanthobacter maritimus TaxID=2161824 RepID=A0A369Q4G2_9SPHN|nr:hypothetical protein [Alteripontixanthobacter maritimus]RDC59781.1 hypothetical protein HME9302_00976 [Alteripontixanthobacter maritimus]
MAGASISAEIEAAYRSVGVEVGEGKAFTVTLIEPGEGQANPWDEPGGAATRHKDIPALVGSTFANAGTGGDAWIDGSLIRADDELIKIAGTAPNPEQDWQVEMKGVTYQIVMIQTMQPAGFALGYTLVLRNGAPATTTVGPPDPASPFSAEFSAEFA